MTNATMATSTIAAPLPILDDRPVIHDKPAPSLLPIVERDRGAALLQHILEEQQTLTAVEQFAQYHDKQDSSSRSQRYEKLLPATAPAPGEQYAFEVDLDRCSGCKACVTACHSLNGLADNEAWRDVGLLQGGDAHNPVLQHVTTACHHCLEPACLSACPVDAYEKDPRTGIVRHLDDQCFGCQYCTLACPYDVPKYNKERGIVRKCDMCAGRLAAGEPPACAAACPHQAIAITVIDQDDVRENAEIDRFLPGAPDPHLTLPTTTFKTKKPFPANTRPVDYYSINPQHPHWPLIIMLVLTQLAVGAFSVGFIFHQQYGPSAAQPLLATLALAAGLLALAASTFHLGRPHLAFRAIIGLAHSWLSREIVAFAAFAAAATTYSAVLWSAAFATTMTRALAIAVVITGLSGLFCSVKIYSFTHREFWSFTRTFVKFTLTAIILGLGTTTVAMFLFANGAMSVPADTLLSSTILFVIKLTVAITGIKLFYELALLRHLGTQRHTAMKRSAILTIGSLRNVFFARIATGLLGGVILPGLLLSQTSTHSGVTAGATIIAILSLGLLLTGELLERYHYFAAVAIPRMPGNPRS